MFGLGAIWGFVALSLLLVALRGSNAFYFGNIGVHGLRAIKFALFWALMFILVAFFEEFLFRGYSLYTLRRGIGFWPAALLLSALFGWVHLGNQGESWRGASAAGLIGLFFCFTLFQHGKLVVRGRAARVVGLGRELLLWGSGTAERWCRVTC